MDRRAKQILQEWSRRWGGTLPTPRAAGQRVRSNAVEHGRTWSNWSLLHRSLSPFACMIPTSVSYRPADVAEALLNCGALPEKCTTVFYRALRAAAIGDKARTKTLWSGNWKSRFPRIVLGVFNKKTENTKKGDFLSKNFPIKKLFFFYQLFPGQGT